MPTVKPIPEQYHSVTPMLTTRNAAAAIDFYKRAFGATELYRTTGPGGRVVHAEIKIGDSVIMLGEAAPDMGQKDPETLGGTAVGLLIYCEDADARFSSAVAAGAKVAMPLGDMFWGDRFGELIDPFGHRWAIATHMKDVSPEDIARGMEAAMASAPKKQ